MKVMIVGGTGFIGSLLGEELCREHEVTVTGRTCPGLESMPVQVSCMAARTTEPGQWQDMIAGHECIINLAGASIFTRWTEKTKREIVRSRIETTRNVVEALGGRSGKKTLLINASAVGIYGPRGNEFITETAVPGNDFLAGLTREWEKEAMRAQEHGARVACLRFGVVLGKHGGALKSLERVFRMLLGCRLGTGNQWFSWIHERDIASIVRFVMDNESISGPVNCAAPNPVTNREMTGALASALHRPVLLPPVPGFMLRSVLGEFGGFLLDGQRVIPEKLTERGYSFLFNDFREAVIDLLS